MGKALGVKSHSSNGIKHKEEELVCGRYMREEILAIGTAIRQKMPFKFKRLRRKKGM